jgi:hypothetical protein
MLSSCGEYIGTPRALCTEDEAVVVRHGSGRSDLRERERDREIERERERERDKVQTGEKRIF